MLLVGEIAQIPAAGASGAAWRGSWTRPSCGATTVRPVRRRVGRRLCRAVCQAGVKSSDETPAPRSFRDYALTRGAYQLFGGVVGIVAVGALAATPRAAEILLGLSLLPSGLLAYRSIWAISLIPVTMAYCMQAAVAADRVSSPTYQRLSLALATVFVGLSALKLYEVYVNGFPVPLVGLCASLGIQLLPTIALLKLYGVGTVADVFPGIVSGVKSLFRPVNVTSGIYALLTVGCMAYSGLASFCPAVLVSCVLTVPVDGFVLGLERAMGMLIFLMGIVCFTLKDAADRGRLGYSTFKALNFGVFLTCTAKFAITVQTDRSVVGGLLKPPTWVAMFCLYGGMLLMSGCSFLTAKRK